MTKCINAIGNQNKPEAKYIIPSKQNSAAIIVTPLGLIGCGVGCEVRAAPQFEQKVALCSTSFPHLGQDGTQKSPIIIVFSWKFKLFTMLGRFVLEAVRCFYTSSLNPSQGSIINPNLQQNIIKLLIKLKFDAQFLSTQNFFQLSTQKETLLQPSMDKIY